MRTRVGSPSALNVSASPSPRRARRGQRAFPDPGEIDLDEVADFIFEHMSSCSYVTPSPSQGGCGLGAWGLGLGAWGLGLGAWRR